MRPTQPSDSIGFPGWPRALALAVLFAVSGGIVWSFHNIKTAAFIPTLFAGVFAGMIAGGLVGVHILPTLATMAAFAGILEGVRQGYVQYGLTGRVLGGLTGTVVGLLTVLLPLILTHMSMIVCGKDPFIQAPETEEKPQTFTAETPYQVPETR